MGPSVILGLAMALIGAWNTYQASLKAEKEREQAEADARREIARIERQIAELREQRKYVIYSLAALAGIGLLMELRG